MALELSHVRCRLFWLEHTPWAMRTSLTVRATTIARTRARAAEQRVEQRKRGILLDGRASFRHSLMRNHGIGWSRSLQILKHLEMHEYAPPPEATPAFKEKVLKVVKLVKSQRRVPPANVVS